MATTLSEFLRKINLHASDKTVNAVLRGLEINGIFFMEDCVGLTDGDLDELRNNLHTELKIGERSLANLFILEMKKGTKSTAALTCPDTVVEKVKTVQSDKSSPHEHLPTQGKKTLCAASYMKGLGAAEAKKAVIEMTNGKIAEEFGHAGVEKADGFVNHAGVVIAAETTAALAAETAKFAGASEGMQAFADLAGAAGGSALAAAAEKGLEDGASLEEMEEAAAEEATKAVAGRVVRIVFSWLEKPSADKKVALQSSTPERHESAIVPSLHC